METSYYNGINNLKFFSEYWILNETPFTLNMLIKENKYQYESISLESSYNNTEDSYSGLEKNFNALNLVLENTYLFITKKSKNLSIFSGNYGLSKKKNSFKIDNFSSWSNFEEMKNFDSEIYVEDKQNPKKMYLLKYNLIKCPNNFYQTKLLLISPKYFLVNKTIWTLEFQQNDEKFFIEKNKIKSIFFCYNMINVRIKDNQLIWSKK